MHGSKLGCKAVKFEIVILVRVSEVKFWVKIFDNRAKQIRKGFVGFFITGEHTNRALALYARFDTALNTAAFRGSLLLQVAPNLPTQMLFYQTAVVVVKLGV